MAIDFDDDSIDTPVDQALLHGSDGDSAAENTEAGEQSEAEVKEPAVEDKAGQADTVESSKEDQPASEDGKKPDDTQAAAQQQQRAQQIPRERFDEVNNKLKEERAAREQLEARLAALEKDKTQNDGKQSGAVDRAELERQAMNALLDGDEEKAVALRMQINDEILAIAEKRLEEKRGQSEKNRQEEEQANRFNTAVSQIIEKHPQLDSSSPDADSSLINDVVGWRDVYISQGKPADEALLAAVAKVIPSASTQVAKEDPRSAAAITRNAAAASAQPAAAVAGTGNRAVPITQIPEGQDAWEKLPESERLKALM